MADGRDWYRFVRPNLFAQVTGPKGIEVVVFKYMVKGADEHFRNMPLIVRQVESHTDGVYGLLVFYEPNTKGVFAGSTISELALMLSMSGKLTLDASRPAASWYQQHNRLLWTLDDVSVPTADQVVDSDTTVLSSTLAMKARGDESLKADSLALRFVIHGSKIVDTALCVARVAAASGSNHQPNQQVISGSSSTPATVVIDGPASFTIKSGKCIYKVRGQPRPENHGHEDNKRDNNGKKDDVSDGRSAASSSSEEEAWASGEGGDSDGDSDGERKQ
ncbi:hypothetical protein GGI23_004570 [Coemansia sp. RSA 2559]|nr:hypothetical protein GGI23_004570 [Coemansia sp. RSA 2559]